MDEAFGIALIVDVVLAKGGVVLAVEPGDREEVRDLPDEEDPREGDAAGLDAVRGARLLQAGQRVPVLVAGRAQGGAQVVHAEGGLMLTNRHVVTPGPVVAEAVFLNNEEVELQPVYYDPVHDFGFFRYDPAELRYIEPTELALARFAFPVDGLEFLARHVLHFRIVEQAAREVYPDGALKELTCHYHRIALGKFEAFRDLLDRAGEEVPPHPV